MASRPRVRTMPPMNEEPSKCPHGTGVGLAVVVVDGTGVVVLDVVGPTVVVVIFGATVVVLLLVVIGAGVDVVGLVVVVEVIGVVGGVEVFGVVVGVVGCTVVVDGVVDVVGLSVVVVLLSSGTGTVTVVAASVVTVVPFAKNKREKTYKQTHAKRFYSDLTWLNRKFFMLKSSSFTFRTKIHMYEQIHSHTNVYIHADECGI